MNIGRLIRHLLEPGWRVRSAFPAEVLGAIEAAIKKSEAKHRGEIRFAVEGTLGVRALMRGVTPAQRAHEVFAELGVWDTAENNGVLIYLLLADRDVEIVADRGVHARAGGERWEAICREMEAEFRAGRFENGVLRGIASVSAVLQAEYPSVAGRDNPNELPNAPAVL
jgi:uncharacterized membrane protein